MTPSWLQLAVLILAAYRLTRLAGWDDFPPIYKVRAWVIGERWYYGDNELELPGKQPGSEAENVHPGYDRPLLAHLVHCPFCIGWWISLATYLAWVLEPRYTLYALAPFAISGAVGLVAKNLDA